MTTYQPELSLSSTQSASDMISQNTLLEHSNQITQSAGEAGHTDLAMGGNQ